MDWNLGPGESSISLPADLPSPQTITAYERLLDCSRLNFENFQKERGDTLWRRLNDEVASGRLSSDEVERLRRDHDGAYTIPLARRFLETGSAATVTKWMRGLNMFWEFNWIDRSVKGARGRGTLKLFECLRDHGGADEVATLAADHLWFRLIGARYHEGLRQELRKFDTHEWYRALVAEHHRKFGRSQIDRLFDWMDYLLLQLRPFVELGSGKPQERYLRVEGEVKVEREKFLEATAADRRIGTWSV